MANAAAINSALGLSIMSDTMSYSCTSIPASYECMAISPQGWKLHVMSLGGIETWVPSHCDGGIACPSCNGGVEGYKCPWDI